MANARNPNPTRVTDEMWWLWLQFSRLEPTAKLGGFYAAKHGYHDTRKANPRDDYSVVSAIDRKGPTDKASAVDFTFPDAQAGRYVTIEKYSRRLLASGMDRADERGNYLREFYGNANGDRLVDGWDFQSVRPASSDDSHLWHIHLSISRGHSADMKAMRAVVSILAGEPVKVWRAKEAALLAPPKAPRKAPVVPPKAPKAAPKAPVAPPKPPKLATPPAPVAPPPAPAPVVPAPMVPPVVPAPVAPPVVPAPVPAPVAPTRRPREAAPSFLARLRAWLASRY